MTHDGERYNAFLKKNIIDYAMETGEFGWKLIFLRASRGSGTTPPLVIWSWFSYTDWSRLPNHSDLRRSWSKWSKFYILKYVPTKALYTCVNSTTRLNATKSWTRLSQLEDSLPRLNRSTHQRFLHSLFLNLITLRDLNFTNRSYT